MNLCDRREVIGVSCGEYRRHGAFAESIAVPERILYRLPESMSFPEAAMLEAVSVALHAVHVSGDVKGQTALVIGAGMIGLLTMQAARAAGAARVFIADIDVTRLNLARSLGVDEAFNLSGPDLTTRNPDSDRRLGRRRGARSGGPQRDHRHGHRLRAQGRHRHADRQHHAQGGDSPAKGRVTTDPAAGLAPLPRANIPKPST